ncbi:uncharacterized protein ZSWIM9-like [Discoglossus pictus]
MATSVTKPLGKEEMELMRKQFFSWKEFSDFFDDWCEQTKSIFLLRHALPIIKCQWLDLKPELVASLKFSKVRLLCKSGRSRKKVDLRKRKDLCKAYLFVRLGDEQDRLVLSNCQLKHNHFQCPVTFSYNFKRGYLMDNSCMPLRITNQVSKRFLHTVDIQRLLSSCKTYENGVLDTLRALDNVTTRDPGARVKVMFVKDRPVVKTVFILTSEMRTVCQRFPLLLIFDQMGSINEFEVYALLCVKDNGQGQEVAFFLTQKDTPDVLRFTLASAVQSIPDIKQKVQCMILGASFVDPKVVNELLPNASVHICHSQVIETLQRKAQDLGVLNDEMVWPTVCELHKAETSNDYNKAVRKLKRQFPSDFVNYFMENWHPFHHMWVKAWTPAVSKGVDAGQIIQLHQQAYTSAMSNASTLSQCILVLMAQHILEVESEDIKGEDVVNSYKLVCKSEPASLIEEELSFANHGTYNIIRSSDGFSLSDGVTDFFMDSELTSCSCTIYSSSLLPCRHLFIARFQTGQALFDMNLLLQNKSALLQRDGM